MTTRGNIEIFFQSKFPFAKSLPKYFWEVGELPDDSSNTKYISVAVSLSNTITLFLSGDGLVQHIFFQHVIRYHLIFVSKLVGLRESLASIENTIYYVNDICFLTFPSF